MFQSDLLDLLDTFRVTGAGDYHRLGPAEKPYFVRRLYRIFADHMDEAVADLSATDGLKLHFGVSGRLTDTNSNVPTETFLKKMAFFASRTLVTFPFTEVTDKQQLRALSKKPQKSSRRRDANQMLFGEIAGGRDALGGYIIATKQPVHEVDTAAFDDLITTTCMLRPALRVGAVYLLPCIAFVRKASPAENAGVNVG